MSAEITDNCVKDVCVCILAHNEQKHIASTIQSIVEGNKGIVFNIVVYANGCTDNTLPIVKQLCLSYPNLRLRELEKASKTLAWNAAFQENDEAILVFSDGDVTLEPGVLLALCNSFKQNDAIVLSSCQYWPQKIGLSFSQKITGFLQIPLAQDFLTGCFYAVRKRGLEKKFAKKGIEGIPEGIVGEDFFLEHLVSKQHFIVVEKKCFYEPPVLEDYWKYLARIRWQEEQIALFFSSFCDTPAQEQRGMFSILKNKISCHQDVRRLLLGVSASIIRYVVVFVYKSNIKKCYHGLGPIVRQAGDVLSSTTRSISAK